MLPFYRVPAWNPKEEPPERGRLETTLRKIRSQIAFNSTANVLPVQGPPHYRNFLARINNEKFLRATTKRNTR